MTLQKFAIAIAVALAGAASVSAGETKQPVKSEKSTHVDSKEADFKEMAPGASRAVLWGNPDKGPYGAFTKLEPGKHFDLHTHTNDLRIVVLQGAYVYEPENGERIRVGAGQFFIVPAKVRHASGGDEKEGALFYEESTGKFDLNFVEAKPEKR